MCQDKPTLGKTWWGDVLKMIGGFMIFLQNFSLCWKISGMSLKWRQIAPLIPYKKLQEGAPKETSTSSNPNPSFPATYCSKGIFQTPKPPGWRCPEKPRHGTKTTIAQTTPNFVDVLELPGRNKKLGYTPENERLEPKNPPWMKMYFLLKIGIFQPVMWVFRGVWLIS